MAPGMSSQPVCRSDSFSTRGAAKAATRPIGTLMRKVSRQPSTPRGWSRPVSQPPRIRPMAAPMPDMVAYAAIARLRWGPAGNVVVIRASAAGAASAAPTPCRPREPSSSASFWREAAEQRSDREDGQAGHEQQAPSVEVAEAAAEEQQATEGERVAGHDPGQVGLGDVEVGADVGQRDVRDRRVEHDHQLRGEDEHEGETRVRDLGLLLLQRRVRGDRPLGADGFGVGHELDFLEGVVGWCGVSVAVSRGSRQGG